MTPPIAQLGGREGLSGDRRVLKSGWHLSTAEKWVAPFHQDRDAAGREGWVRRGLIRFEDLELRWRRLTTDGGCHAAFMTENGRS
jgi:hypothetical protein